MMSMHNHSGHHNMSMGATTAGTIMHNHNHDNNNHDMTTMMAGGHGGGHEGHGDMNNGMNAHGGMNMHMMKMYFHTGISEYVLFQDCLTSSTGGMFGACAVVFVVAILYEGLKYLREVLLQRSIQNEPRLTYGDKDHLSIDGQSGCGDVMSRMLSVGHLVQTVLHVIQVFVSYCLMLVFMTYNVWLCIAVILGAGIGYFLFGWKRAVVVDSNEHCH